MEVPVLEGGLAAAAAVGPPGDTLESEPPGVAAALPARARARTYVQAAAVARRNVAVHDFQLPVRAIAAMDMRQLSAVQRRRREPRRAPARRPG
eukprot:3675069-Lingulodinium_polyedra.AAC.1